MEYKNEHFPNNGSEESSIAEYKLQNAIWYISDRAMGYNDMLMNIGYNPLRGPCKNEKPPDDNVGSLLPIKDLTAAIVPTTTNIKLKWTSTKFDMLSSIPPEILENYPEVPTEGALAASSYLIYCSNIESNISNIDKIEIMPLKLIECDFTDTGDSVPLTYTDTTAKEKGKTYYYRIVALDVIGNKAVSNIVKCVIPGGTPPVEPPVEQELVGVRYGIVGSGKVSLTALTKIKGNVRSSGEVILKLWSGVIGDVYGSK